MFLAKMLLKPNIVSRDEWKAHKPEKRMKCMEKEVTHLVVSFTDTPQCNNKEECILRVEEIQRQQVEENGKNDIQYNFLIGGDGNVYEGRGWEHAPEYRTDKAEFQELNGNALEVAFIGEYGSTPTVVMLKAFIAIVLKAINEKVLTQEFKKLKPCVVAGDKVMTFKGNMEEEINKVKNGNVFAKLKNMLF